MKLPQQLKSPLRWAYGTGRLRGRGCAFGDRSPVDFRADANPVHS